MEEALSLIQLANERGRTIAVGHIERFNPAVIALKRLLAGHHLGRIYCLHARRLGPFPPRIRDVGVALDLATHDLDVMRYLVDTEVERAYAEIRDCTGQQHEDLLFGVIRFQNGVVGMLDVNWLTPTKVRELSVTGECGMYAVNCRRRVVRSPSFIVAARIPRCRPMFSISMLIGATCRR